MIESSHIAVFAGKRPVIPCGPSDDPESVCQAKELAESEAVRTMFDAAGHKGPITYRMVAGSEQIPESPASNRLSRE